MKDSKKYYNDLTKIRDMVGHIRTISEAIAFNEDEYGYDEGEEQEPAPQQEEMPAPEEQDMGPAIEDGTAEGARDLSKMKPMEDEKPTEEEGLMQLGEVDQIREIALRGMIKLCKNPEDAKYQALKKIFQFCDKAVENTDKEA